MAGPKKTYVARTQGIDQGIWYADGDVNCPPTWAAPGAVEGNGDVWYGIVTPISIIFSHFSKSRFNFNLRNFPRFHGGNIPGYYISNEMWRFRPSTLQWMWVSGNGTSQSDIIEADHVEPPAADA